MKCNPATFADLRLYGGPRIALNNGKLYIWGDPETGCLTRKPVERRKFD